MKIDKLSLPHPVVGLGDDAEGFYSVKSAVSQNRGKVAVRITHQLRNKTIEEMIENDRAVFAVDLNCPKTIYREIFVSKNLAQIIELPSDYLRDKVSLTFYVIVTQEVKEYALSGMNEDYDEQAFHLKKGDVIAYGGDTFFIAAKTWESNGSVSSFLDIVKSDKKRGPYSIDLHGEQIIVYLSAQDYESYLGAAQAGYDPIFHSAIVLPTLVYAIQQMKEESLYKERKWYQMLEFKREADPSFSELDWEEDKIPEIAQLLLGNPLTRTFENINGHIESAFVED